MARMRKEQQMATIHDYARMCKAHAYCEGCPMVDVWNGACDEALIERTAECEAIIDKWCAEHPQKTYLQDFLEKFPNAQVNFGNASIICASYVYGDALTCKGRCAECWNTVMPDEAEKEEV
jgi:hypothetical protein